MTIQQLHYAIVISETGSLSKAAEILYISQPSLSGSMRELEKELGIIIFHRSGRGVTLTNDGTTMLIVTRELSFAQRVATNALFMHNGKILESAPAGELFSHPQQPETIAFLRKSSSDYVYSI